MLENLENEVSNKDLETPCFVSFQTEESYVEVE